MRLFILPIGLSLAMVSAYANQPLLKNDPKRPVKAISYDLGITADEFIVCFNDVKPTPGGNRPESHQRVQSNKKILLSCLQDANPMINNDFLDAVMDRYRPGGRLAQVPMR